MDKRLLFLFLIFGLSGCLDNSGDSTSSPGESTSPSKAPASALEAKSVLSTSGLKFYNLNGGALTGNENLILACTSDNQACKSVCISSYFPSAIRYSLFRTDFLLGNKCAAALLAYPNNSGLPAPFYYWRGQYVTTPPSVTGSCSVNLSSPTYMGRSAFYEVRVPEGQPTPANGSRIYNTHTWYDSNANEVTTWTLQNYLPPSYWSFKDTSFTASDLTMALVNGYACIKLEEVGNAFQ